MNVDRERSLGEVTNKLLACLMGLSADERPTYSWLLTKTFEGKWKNDGLYEQDKGSLIITEDGLFDGLAALAIAAARKGQRLDFSSHEGMAEGLPYNLDFAVIPMCNDAMLRPAYACVLHRRVRGTWGRIEDFERKSHEPDRLHVAFNGRCEGGMFTVVDDEGELTLCVTPLGGGEYGVEVFDCDGELCAAGYAGDDGAYEYNVPLCDATEDWLILASDGALDLATCLEGYRLEPDGTLMGPED